MFILKAIGAFPLSGTIMLTFRLVEPELKSMANAVSALLMSAFGKQSADTIESVCKFVWKTMNSVAHFSGYFPAPILMGKLSCRSESGYSYCIAT